MAAVADVSDERLLADEAVGHDLAVALHLERRRGRKHRIEMRRDQQVRARPDALVWTVVAPDGAAAGHVVCFEAYTQSCFPALHVPTPSNPGCGRQGAPMVPYVHTTVGLGFKKNVMGYITSPVELESYATVTVG